MMNINTTIGVKVSAIDRETSETICLTLVPEAGDKLPPYDPGAHIDLHLPGGFTRQYSLWEAPEDLSRYKIAVKLELQSRGGSKAVHEALSIGDCLTISAPRNNFKLDMEAEHTILFAGGIGVTPLLSMAKSLDRQQKSYEMHYFSRAPELTAFRNLNDEPGVRQRTEYHYGLDAEAVCEEVRRILTPVQKGAQIYLCGPKPFMDTVLAIAEEGWPAERVHCEYFVAEAPSLSADGDSFEIYLSRSDKRFVVPSDKTIAEVLLENGVDISVSCEQGVCGTCITGVQSGIPEHLDLYLSNEEHEKNDRMALCVSRSVSNEIVLDL